MASSANGWSQPPIPTEKPWLSPSLATASPIQRRRARLMSAAMTSARFSGAAAGFWPVGARQTGIRPGLDRNLDNAIAVSVYGLPVRRGNHRVPGWRCGSRRADLALFQGPARLFAVAGLRAAGDDPRACGRRFAARRIFARAPAVSADPGGAEDGDQRLPRRRRQEFLRARRHRLSGPGARRAALCPEHRLESAAAGRLDHHPASREKLPAHQRGVVHP